MSDFSLIILAAGSSSRFGLGVKKQWLRIDDNPLWLHVTHQFEALNLFSKIIIVGASNEVLFMQNHTKHLVVEGGNQRQDSLKNALHYVDTPYVMVSDAARACISPKLVTKLLNAKNDADVIVPFLPQNDTTVYQNKTIDRDQLKAIQTPQVSKTELLKQALQSETLFTDDSSAIVAIKGTRAFVEGEAEAHKLTRLSDLTRLACVTKPSSNFFTGTGFDVHAFEDHKRMALAGVYIDDVNYGFKAHSDGDVAIHALIDALLGAAGMDDIGTLFPDNDETYKGIDSKSLLTEVHTRIVHVGYEVVNADITIMAEQPKISPYKQAMRHALAALLHLPLHHMNVKATTTEKLGFVGRKEGVAVTAGVTLKYFDWTKE